MAIFVSMTEASKEDDVILNWVPYIHSLLHFRIDKKNKIRALIDFGSKVNAIKPAYTSELDLRICQTDVGA